MYPYININLLYVEPVLFKRLSKFTYIETRRRNIPENTHGRLSQNGGKNLVKVIDVLVIIHLSSPLLDLIDTDI